MERVPEIRKTLETANLERYHVPDVMRLFGVSKSRAKETIGKAGGRAASGFLSVTRAKLLDYVIFSPEAKEYEAGRERREELARKLEASREDQKLRKVVFKTGTDDEMAAWRYACSKLKAAELDAEIEGGVLRLYFRAGDPNDFVEKVYMLGMAVRNELAIRNDGHDAERLPNLLKQFNQAAPNPIPQTSEQGAQPAATERMAS